MKKFLGVLGFAILEIFLVSVIPIIIYMDNSNAGIVIHPSFYCLSVYINLKILQRKNISDDSGIAGMFVLNLLLSFIYRAI